jgi:hypothetical protein
MNFLVQILISDYGLIMPYVIKKNANGTYKLVNKNTGKVYAKASTKSNVERQMKLLNYLDHR